MSNAPEEPVVTVAQARAMAAAAPEVRLELLDGVIVAMGRATPWHAVITAAVARQLASGLERPCRIAAQSLAVGTDVKDPTFVHPDLAILCGPNVLHPDDDTVVMNPQVVVEVLSPSTALRDWNTKLPKYKAMASLRAIFYLAHDARRVTALRRTEEGWEEIIRERGTLELEVLGLRLDIDALYDEGVDDGGP